MIIGELSSLDFIVVLRGRLLRLALLLCANSVKRPIDVVFVGKSSNCAFDDWFGLLLHWAFQLYTTDLVNVSWLPGLNSEGSALGYLLYYFIELFSRQLLQLFATGKNAKIVKD